MAAYPDAVFEPRITENLPGVVFDADLSTEVFAEDYAYPADEIVAIETALGLVPQGSYDDVAARLDDFQLVRDLFVPNYFSTQALRLGGDYDPTSIFLPGGYTSFLVSSTYGVGPAVNCANPDGGVFGYMNAFRSRGTLAAPTETFDQDGLLGFNAFGFDINDHPTLDSGIGAATIIFFQDGDAGDGYVPGGYSFRVREDASTVHEGARARASGDWEFNYNCDFTTLSVGGADGIDATIVTAALTTLGSQGSMTFTKGILTAQTPAT